MKAVKIYSSNPIRLAKGFKKLAIIVRRLSPLNPIFAKSQITRPAGAATKIALPRTNKVLSKMERISIFPTCGFLYGGSSKIKEEGIPFKIVLDNILEITKVQKIPRSITRITVKVEIKEALNPRDCTCNKYSCNRN